MNQISPVIQYQRYFRKRSVPHHEIMSTWSKTSQNNLSLSDVKTDQVILEIDNVASHTPETFSDSTATFQPRRAVRIKGLLVLLGLFQRFEPFLNRLALREL
jgi:hypothetical protein